MGLKHRDLEHTVLSRISIDEYEPKTGEARDVVVLGFRVMDQAPGKDLYSFLNSGTVKIRDVEVSPNPDLENYYMVFVEMDRKPGVLRHIHDLLQDIEQVAGPLKWRASTHLTDDYLDVHSKEFSKYFIERPSRYQTRAEFEKNDVQEQLQEQEEADNDISVGDQVQIVAGPLMDLLPDTTGVVVGMENESGTDFALLNITGYEADEAIPVEVEYLELVSDDQMLPEDQDAGCPAPTQNLELNTNNRDSAIQAEHIKYGPLNVDVPGDYWQELADHWDTDLEAAQASLCGNCVAFDISPRMLDCMPGEISDADGELGYCWMHHFKCHSARTCRTWAKGGPITEDEVSLDWQSRNPIEKDDNMENNVVEFLKYSNASAESISENIVTLSYGRNSARLQILGCGNENATLAKFQLAKSAVDHGDSRMKLLNQMLGEARAVWIDDHIVIYHANHQHLLVTKPC